MTTTCIKKIKFKTLRLSKIIKTKFKLNSKFAICRCNKAQLYYNRIA